MLPAGASAALEGLIRALEHFETLSEQETHTESTIKHLFLIVSSPPDLSAHPLWNNYHRFDGYGWNECAQWMKQVSTTIIDL
jgi:hypothetical protein